MLARRIPEEGVDDWTLAHPKGQKQAAVEKNEQCDGMYVPAVRLVKHWNRGEDKPLRSYHGEAILWHALAGPVDYAEAIVKFFDAAFTMLSRRVRVRPIL